MRVFYALVFIFSDSSMHAMLAQKAKEEVELIPGSTTRKNRVKRSCGKTVTCCLPVTCGVLLVTFLATAIYAVAHPPQECWTSGEPYLNQSKIIEISGRSYDVYIQNCGSCLEEVMRCNLPEDGIETSDQLINFVIKEMLPICGPDAVYKFKINVAPERDLIAPVRMPGDQVNMFRRFFDQKNLIERGCKKRPLSKKFTKGFKQKAR